MFCLAGDTVAQALHTALAGYQHVWQGMLAQGAQPLPISPSRQACQDLLPQCHEWALRVSAVAWG